MNPLPWAFEIAEHVFAGTAGLASLGFLAAAKTPEEYAFAVLPGIAAVGVECKGYLNRKYNSEQIELMKRLEAHVEETNKLNRDISERVKNYPLSEEI